VFDWASRLSFLRSRNALIAIVAAVAVIAVGAGLFLLTRPQSQPIAKATPRVIASAAPSVAELGTQTVIKASMVQVLTVVASSPTSGSTGAAADTAIDLTFNLPVDPASAPSFFSVLPSAPGTFSQGPTPKDVVFTPTKAFGLGVSVKVVVRKGYASRDGYALQDDYSFSFITALKPGQVVFQVGNQVARLHSVQSGHSVDVTLHFGDDVPADIELETFRATSSDLLAGLVHDANGAYVDRPIATGAMHSVGKKKATNGGSYTITQPDGVYLLLAVGRQGQYGAMWLDVSKFGVLVRQDDQKVVVAGEDLTNGTTTATFDIAFFNLLNRVERVRKGSFTGTAVFPAAYPAPIDVAVATSGGEDVVIPLVAPQTNADIKVVGDLSKQPQIFLTTDRAGYQKGDIVQFAGLVRTSNDQAYTVPTTTTIAIWSGYGENKLVSKAVQVDNDGTFRGSFAMPNGAFNSDGSDGQMTLNAGTIAQEASSASPFFTVIAVLGNHTPQATIKVSLDKSTYLASDKIVAAVEGVDSTGKPLAAKSVRLTIYSNGHSSKPSELDGFAAASSWGVAVQNVTVSLDASGRATYTFNANVAQKAADQEVTLAATYGSDVGARTALVYQAAAEAFLLPSRSVYKPGDNVIAPFVVESTAGLRVGGAPMVYEFDKTDYAGDKATTTVVASGRVTADANGIGVVRTRYPGPVGDVLLRIRGKDAAGNAFEDAKPLTISGDPASLLSFAPSDSLIQLSVTSDKIAYAVGDTAHLTITSPAALSVFLSVERGRIHLSKWVSLAQGDNPLTLAISPDLAPGITLTFSYFQNGSYVSEGLPISINNADRQLKMTMATDQPTYTAGQTAHVTVTVTDSTGAPASVTLWADGYDASMSANKLVDQNSIAGAFLSPALRGTDGSSSLTGIGDWGGRCGAGGNVAEPAVTKPGHAAVWLTVLATNGKATIDVPITRGSVRLTLFAMTSTTSLGQGQIDLSVH